MDTFDAIYQRRCVKHFDPDHRLTNEEERHLLEAAIQSPFSFNIQHWRFVMLHEPDLRRRIRALAFEQSQVTDPDGHILGPMIAIGRATQPTWPKPGQLGLAEMVYGNRFHQPTGAA